MTPTEQQGGLAARQAELVHALVAGGDVPTGFDADRLHAARTALLRKRMREVAGHWPLLLHDDATQARFVAWADGRPRTTTHLDGLAFAEHLEAKGALSEPAAGELRTARRAMRRRVWHRQN